MDKKQIKITDTTFRDGQQSLIATRMPTDEMLPILEKIDTVGFHSLEVWGGATFDSCLRFLKEDPWERLRKIRAVCKNTKLQMLFRGQNALGYRIYPNDFIEAFLAKAIENGIDIVRIFDALNDLRNLHSSIKAVKKAKGHAQLAISYTTSKVHTTEYFVGLAKELESMGADSICIKDMAGLLLPENAYELVKAIKSVCKVPLQLHSHYTTGLAAMSYMRAVDAGVDVLDCSFSAFALGTSQPATEVMVAALKDSPGDTQLDGTVLAEIAEQFAPLREKYVKSGLLSEKMLGVDINALLYQVPGGMLSNLYNQLKEANALNKYDDVLREIPRVREDFGFPPLVTPSSQIVGTQAVFNILMGERYKIVPKESKELAQGMYGKTPVPISSDILKKVIGNEKPITKKPSELVDPIMKKAEKELGTLKEQDEDVLSYVLFPQIAMDYFKYRQAQKYKVDPALADVENKVYPV